MCVSVGKGIAVHTFLLCLPAILRCVQTEWRDDRMSSRQVTITVTQGVRQVQRGGWSREGSQPGDGGDRGGWRKETSRTSFQGLRPTEEPKEAPVEKSPK